MPKFSVKRPFTVLVGVALVLVLGVVAFTKLTTDLLPNMDLPYMVVYATDPGASPEAVESDVTKPLESALGSTMGLKNITSTSSENVSYIVLEFEQGTDMNAVSIEMSNTIDQIEGSLPDTVGTPVMMQITPDMMPVMVASVDVDGMDAKEVSDYVNDELLTAFERLDGVASVDTTGLVTSEVEVVLDQDKIDALNDRVLAAVDSELADAKDQLDEGQAQLDSAKAQLKEGQTTLDEAADEAAQQLAAASAQVDAATAKLNALLAQETTLQANQTAYQAEKEALETYAEQNDSVRMLAIMLVAYDFTGQVPELDGVPSTEDLQALAQSSATMLKALEDPAEYIRTMSDEDYAAAMEQVQAVLQAGGQDISQLAGVSRENFAALTETTAYAAERVEEIDAALNDIATELAAAEAMKPTLESALEQAEDAYAQVEAGKITATLSMTEGATEISVGKASLESAQEELDAAVDEFEQARDQAYESADISGIITADMISNILIAENFEMPAGYISDSSDNSYVLKVGEAYDSIEELSDMILFHMDTGDIGDIRLTDVASVEYTNEDGDTAYAKVNGNDAVVLSFSKQSTASTSAVSDAINEEIESLQTENTDLHITPLMDQGEYIHLIINNVLSNLVYGGLLAVLVLLIFLRDIRPTIIIAFSIPLSVLFAIVLMYFSNMTLNIISLSGLALGVGMLVDNSIVVIENIYRLRNLGMPPAKAAVRGAAQMSGAIFSSTLTTVCVFLPIVFTQGLTRQIFADMGLTIAYALSASLIVALTVVPAMSATLLRKEKVRSHSRLNLMDQYEKLLRWCLSHRLATLGAAGALLAVAAVGAVNMGMIFIPEMSSDQMSATLTLPDDATETELQAAADQAMELMQETEGVQTVGAMSGGSGLLSSGSADSVSFYLILEEDADNKTVAEAITERADELNGELAVTESTMDMSSYFGSGIQIDVYGDDLDELQTVCAELAEKLEDVEGLTEISDGNEDPDAQKVVTVNKDAAMQQGLTVAQVYAALAEKLSSEVESTTLTVGEEELPVVVKKPSEVTTDNLMEQTITATDSTTGEEKEVKLDTIASQSDSKAPTSINRDNNERTMSVTASVDDEHNVTLVSQDVQEILDTYDLPDGIRVEISGETETISDAMQDLMLMLLLAVIFIYLIMVAQFQSLLHPFIVMFTLPLAFTGGLLALLLTGMEISVLAMLGFIMLAGVVVNNGIVFVSCVNELRLDGMPKQDALVEAGKMRMRPILMTALTTVLSMSTMAMGIGSGAEMGQPMAIVVIGGLTYATVLTLVIVPVLYDVFSRKKTMKRIDVGENDNGDDDVG